MQPSKPKCTSQGPLTIWHCMDVPRVLKLLSMRPPASWRRWHRWALLPPCALYNSAMSWLEDRVYGQRVAAAEIHPSPLFIIGVWRSGTTLLHNLISLDRQFIFPNMYQAAFPHHFLLTERVVTWLTAPLLPKSRPMDNVEAGWRMPQEDEIGLCALSLISPYLMCAFPEKSLYRSYYDFRDAPGDVVEQWKAVFLGYLRKLSYRDRKPIVLKSPSHTWRIPLLLEMFPQAKFVYIHRHPYDVFRSTLHLRDTLFEANTLGPVIKDGWEEDIISDCQWADESYQRDRRLIPEGNLHEVRFEDLESDPLGEVERMYGALSLDGFDVFRQSLEREVERLKDYRKNHFRTLPLEKKRIIYERLRGFFDRYGYDPEGADRGVEGLRRLAVPA